MIKIILQIELAYPYAQSLSTLFDLSRLWNFIIISGNTNSKIVKVSISSDIFKKLFGVNAEKNKKYSLDGSKSFIKDIKVIDIKIKEKS